MRKCIRKVLFSAKIRLLKINFKQESPLFFVIVSVFVKLCVTEIENFTIL